jgi:ureidoacrylate peracid hydrolase
MTAPLLDTLALKAAPGTAALVVIDVQNDFVADGGFFARIGADVGFIQQSVPPLERLIEAARAAGVLVVFVQAIYDPPDLSPAMRERNARTGSTLPRCLTGSWGADFYRVRPQAGDAVIIKHRYSAMTDPALPTLLRERGIQSLLLTGVATDTCVESTARDAYFADWYVTLVADCCAAASRSDHEGVLPRFSRDYGLVTTAEAVMATWTA